MTNATIDQELQTAVRRGDLNGVERALKMNAQPNAIGPYHTNALGLACREGYAKIAKLLIANGAAVDMLPEEHCPMIKACDAESVDCIFELLKAGATPNVQDEEGATVLCKVIEFSLESSEKILLLKVLFAYGADVNFKKDRTTRSPMEFAIFENEVEIVKLLLEHGANTNAQFPSGFTALDLARGNHSAWDFDKNFFSDKAQLKIQELLRQYTSPPAQTLQAVDEIDELLPLKNILAEHNRRLRTEGSAYIDEMNRRYSKIIEMGRVPSSPSDHDPVADF